MVIGRIRVDARLDALQGLTRRRGSSPGMRRSAPAVRSGAGPRPSRAQGGMVRQVCKRLVIGGLPLTDPRAETARR